MTSEQSSSSVTIDRIVHHVRPPARGLLPIEIYAGASSRESDTAELFPWDVKTTWKIPESTDPIEFGTRAARNLLSGGAIAVDPNTKVELDIKAQRSSGFASVFAQSVCKTLGLSNRSFKPVQI